jgi:hypothetical protein
MFNDNRSAPNWEARYSPESGRNQHLSTQFHNCARLFQMGGTEHQMLERQCAAPGYVLPPTDTRYEPSAPSAFERFDGRQFPHHNYASMRQPGVFQSEFSGGVPQNNQMGFNVPVQATLYYGGVLNPDGSLIGGCAWCLIDNNNRRIAHGSYSVVQEFPSLVRLEYEGLLNGLQACLLKNLLSVKVRGCNGLSVSQFPFPPGNLPDKQCAMLSSMYHSVDDLSCAINKVLPRFKYYEFGTIPGELNGFVFKVAKGAIKTHERKDEIKLEKISCKVEPFNNDSEMLVKPNPTVNSHWTGMSIPYVGCSIDAMDI